MRVEVKLSRVKKGSPLTEKGRGGARETEVGVGDILRANNREEFRFYKQNISMLKLRTMINLKLIS